MTMFSDQNSQIASHELFVLLIVIIILFSRQFGSVSLSVVSMPPWQSLPWCKVKNWTVRQLSNVCRSVTDADDGDDDVITLLTMTVAVAMTNSWSLVSGKNEQFNGQRQGRTVGHRSPAKTNTWSSVIGKDKQLVIGHRKPARLAFAVSSRSGHQTGQQVQLLRVAGSLKRLFKGAFLVTATPCRSHSRRQI